jgi:dihydroorotase
MANTMPVNDEPAVTRFVADTALAVGAARVYPVGALSRGCRGEELAEIGEMVAAGAVAISDSPVPVTSSLLMRRALEYCRSFAVPIMAHPQDPVLADGGCMHEGRVATRIGLRGMPAAAEEAMIARDLLLAGMTGGRLHICHVSTAGGLELIRQARRQGLEVTCEVTAHHFTLTDEDLSRSNYDPRFKMLPPLRTACDRDAVLEAIADGTVDAIVSDHAPHHADEMELDFSDAPFGVVGLESVVSLAVDRLVHTGLIDLGRLVTLMSTSPARVLGLPEGRLEAGSSADLTLLDLDAEVTVEPSSFASKGRNTPFAGMRLRGAPAATVVGGRLVWRRG